MKTNKRAQSTTRWGVSLGRTLQFTLASIVMQCGFAVSAEAMTWTVCPATCDFILIQAAIDDVGTIDGDTLAISADLYTTEAITITKDLTLLGEGVGATVIQFGGDTVITIASLVTATLSDLTVSGGFSGNSGGGIVVGDHSEVFIRNAQVIGNNSISAGGGIYTP